MHQYDDYAQSLRSIYSHSIHKPTHTTTPKDAPRSDQVHAEHSFLYRQMKFLPKQKYITQTKLYTGIRPLETYIDQTKTELDERLSLIYKRTEPNLDKQTRQAIATFKTLRTELTIKPADKNLGIVIMDTDDYIQQCTTLLADTATYRLAQQYPTSDIEHALQSTITSFSQQIKSIHKNLHNFLLPKTKSTKPPNFYGLPKIHKQFDKLPPMRPIVSHSNSILSASASFIDHALQPIARSYHDYLHNSTTLLTTLQDLHVPDDALLVTIDVQSLYPSIPQTECLQIVYNEMHARKHHLLYNPNLIIRLLHTNVNYNYFNFGTLTFQQTNGTAMGASFSPTIANIFLSVTIDNFLHTQQLKPLLLKRYIDDIFLLWPHSLDTLNTFLHSLNSFHSSLNFTHNLSSHQVDFLDVTIYKDFTFQYTNILTTKTFQKAKNLFQYVHYNSNHPRTIFTGLIKAECIRYARTNSQEHNYHALLKLFKQRLLNRNYPNTLIDKTFYSVNYKDRQQFLKPVTSHTFTRRPILKCPPPPHFHLLKTTILQYYNMISSHAPPPRFVTLGHKTLRHELVRAKTTPTDEQFMDIVLRLDNTSHNHHSTTGSMPTLQHVNVTITTCKHPKCTTCKHLNTNTFFTSTSTRQQYTIRHSATCNSSNIIYLITCTKCKKQYVGYTQTRLKDRLNRHQSNIRNNKTIHICIHFNFPDHKLSNLSVQIIDTADTLQELRKREQFWILELRTYTPKGLNYKYMN